jgi:hypothetical protein
MGQWIQNHIALIAVVGSLIGGGSMGAIITALVNYNRNKRQPISFYPPSFVEIRPEDFEGMPNSDTHKNEFFSLAKGGRLFTGALYLANTGNLDIPRFHFGVTLSSGRVVLIAPYTLDRHHSVKHQPQGDDALSQVDFILEPFNREEVCFINFVVATPLGEVPGAVEVSSPHPTQFKHSLSDAMDHHRRLPTFPTGTTIAPKIPLWPNQE